MMGWLVLFAIVSLILFIFAPKWFGKTTSSVARKTKTAFRKNYAEFKKGVKEEKKESSSEKHP